jgi:peptidoglycan/LPS O-acetylase OafA/YrhL
MMAATQPHSPGRSQFNTAVHALRAIATLMVFGCHMLDSFHTYMYPSSTFLGAIVPYALRFGTFGVELFFVISGYVIMASVERYAPAQFAYRRFVRIYPLFAFFTIAFFVLNAVTHLYPDRLSLTGLALNLTFTDIYFGALSLSPNAWSLTFEANFYLFAALMSFALLGKRSFMIGALAVCGAAFLLRFPIALYFVAGCLAYFFRDRQPSSCSVLVQVAVIVAWCIAAALVDHEPVNMSTSTVMANLALLLVTAAFFFVASSPGSLFRRIGLIPWIAFIGTISYSFYLTHPYSYLPLRMMFQKLNLGHWNMAPAALVYFPIMTAAAIAASYVVHRFLEIAPYRAIFGEAVYREPVEASDATLPPTMVGAADIGATAKMTASDGV